MLRLILDQRVEGFSVRLRVKEQLSTAVTQTADCDLGHLPSQNPTPPIIRVHLKQTSTLEQNKNERISVAEI